VAASIDRTVGGASANSYVTLAEANAYFDEHLNVSEWTDATDDLKNRALIQATRRLDQLSFNGGKATEAQALKWPRIGVVDDEGYGIDSDEIPQQMKDAQCELALAMLASDLLVDTGLEGFEMVEVGPVKAVPKHQQKAGELPENVRREISPFLYQSRANVRLERA